jgi:branched-chain amino acid transport system permease protein
MNRRELSKAVGITAFIILLIITPLLLKSPYWTNVLIMTGVNVLLAASLYIVSRTGQISLATAGFMLLGAYGSVLLVMKVGFSFWIALFLGGLLAAVVALATGYVFFRAKGIYFAILTMLLGEVCRNVAVYWVGLTGGGTGLYQIPRPNAITFPGITTINFDNDIAYYYLLLIIVVLSIIVIYRIERTRLGLSWAAIKETDKLSASVGINVTRYQVLAFAVAAFFAGIAGGLLCHYVSAMSPRGPGGGTFGITTSLYALTYIVVGGEATLAGPIVGAIFLTLLPEIARPLQGYRSILYGGLLLFVVFVMPGGLVSLPERFRYWYRKATGKLKQGRLSQG